MNMETKKSGFSLDNPATERFIIAALLLVTFILSIKQAVPFTSFDEQEIMSWVSDLDDTIFPILKFPPLFIYLHYILSLVYGMVLSFLGIIDSSSAFLTSETGFQFTLEAGRIINGLFAVVLVYTVYRIGRDFFENKHMGLLAALLTASNYLVALYAHIFKPDLLATLLMLIVLFYMLKYYQTSKWGYILAAAFFFGLAVSGRFSAVTLLPCILLAVVFTTGKKVPPPGTGASRWKALRLLPIGAAVGFVLGAPNFLIRPLGNLEAVFTEYTPARANIMQQLEPQSLPAVYLGYLMDLITYLTPVVFALAVLGMVAAFVTRNRRDILISSALLSYVIFFGLSGYYTERFALPLFPIAALLASKTVFLNIKETLRRQGKWPKFQPLAKKTIPLLWLFIIGFFLVQISGIFKTFNLLKTQDNSSRMEEYRKIHNIDDTRYNVGRQLYTPRFPNSNIKLTSGFLLKFQKRDRKKRLHFIQAHLPSYERYTLQNTDEKNPKDKTIKPKKTIPEPGALNLEWHRPFFIAQKQRHQDWNPAGVFLYQLPRGLRNLKIDAREVHLPRTVYSSGHTTFLPLQLYEKNPNFGKLDESNNGIYRHWLYSKKEIRALRIWLQSLHPSPRVMITVNGLEVVHGKRKHRPPVELLEVKELSPRRFYHDYVYRVELLSSRAHLKRYPYYFVLEPVYAETDVKPEQEKDPFFLPMPASQTIPSFLSRKEFPLWIKVFYKGTGIDLSLLKHVNAHVLYDRGTAKPKISDVSPDYFALEKGFYIIRIEGEPLVNAFTSGNAQMTYLYYGVKRAYREIVPLVLEGKTSLDIPLEITSPVCFMKIEFKGLRQNNFLLKRVTVTPDYRKYTNKYLRTRPKKKKGK